MNNLRSEVAAFAVSLFKPIRTNTDSISYSTWKSTRESPSVPFVVLTVQPMTRWSIIFSWCMEEWGSWSVYFPIVFELSGRNGPWTFTRKNTPTDISHRRNLRLRPFWRRSWRQTSCFRRSILASGKKPEVAGSRNSDFLPFFCKNHVQFHIIDKWYVFWSPW